MNYHPQTNLYTYTPCGMTMYVSFARYWVKYRQIAVRWLLSVCSHSSVRVTTEVCSPMHCFGYSKPKHRQNNNYSQLAADVQNSG